MNFPKSKEARVFLCLQVLKLWSHSSILAPLYPHLWVQVCGKNPLLVFMRVAWRGNGIMTVIRWWARLWSEIDDWSSSVYIKIPSHIGAYRSSNHLLRRLAEPSKWEAILNWEHDTTLEMSPGNSKWLSILGKLSIFWDRAGIWRWLMSLWTYKYAP
jgi:hypothetical protein